MGIERLAAPKNRSIDFFKAQLEANIERTTGEIKAFYENKLRQIEESEKVLNNEH